MTFVYRDVGEKVSATFVYNLYVCIDIKYDVPDISNKLRHRLIFEDLTHDWNTCLSNGNPTQVRRLAGSRFARLIIIGR